MKPIRVMKVIGRCGATAPLCVRMYSTLFSPIGTAD